MKELTKVAESIYRHKSGSFYQRVKLNGGDTYRKLAASTVSEARTRAASNKAEYAKFRAGVPGILNPYESSASTALLHQIVERFQKAGYPGRKRDKDRSPKTIAMYANAFEVLLQWSGWKDRPLEHITVQTLHKYEAWRKETAKRLLNGRTIDIELGCLNAALRYATWQGIIARNPLAGLERPTFQTGASRKCRECRPKDAEELHTLARILFSSGSTQVLGWQILFEAFTGCRTSEALACRWDAGYGEPGFLDTTRCGKTGEAEVLLHIKRLKHGVFPWVKVHPALATLLAEMRAWRDRERLGNPWFFPGEKDKHADVSALVHALGRIVKDSIAGKIEGYKLPEGSRRTSHGLRAYYVTTRRSEGIEDAVIASEIGDVTGAAIITSTYGALPPNWQRSNAGKLTWLPEGEPAWAVFANL